MVLKEDSASSLLLNNGFSHQPSSSSISEASNGLTSDQRRKFVVESEQNRAEQYRLQLIKSQVRAEAQLEKQREERKLRIEKKREQDEIRQRKVQQTKKEIERQYKDHLQTRIQHNDDRVANHLRSISQSPNVMHASHIPSTANGDRMTASFTVAFGSSSSRSICTRSNKAVLQSQAAFEARLASFLNGRHSGCFLTQPSSFTFCSLCIKSYVLPWDYQHSFPNAPRRTPSANPSLSTAKKIISSAINVVGIDNKSDGGTTLRPQQLQRSRLSKQQGVGQSDLPQLQRSASLQHFAESAIANSGKVQGVPPLEHAIPTIVSTVVLPGNSNEAPPKRRPTPGRSNIPRDRCHSYAAPTTASMNRQRAPSNDQVPRVCEGRVGDNKSSATAASLGYGRPRIREPPPANQGSSEVPKLKPALANTSERMFNKKPPLSWGQKTPKGVDQPTPVKPPISLGCEASLGLVHEPNPLKPRTGSATSQFHDLSAALSPPHGLTPAFNLGPAPKLATITVKPENAEESLNSPIEKSINTDLRIKPHQVAQVEEVETVSKLEIQGVLGGAEPAQDALFLQGGNAEAKAVQGTLEPIVDKEDEETVAYRAKMVEQRRLAKERLAEEERRKVEDEEARRKQREAEREAAIQLARERAVEEAQLAAKARQIREAAEQEAREADERATKERPRLQAVERDRLENFRKAEEEERAKRKMRLESIMSRVNRSDRVLSRKMPTSNSCNSLGGIATAEVASTESETKTALRFSLGPGSNFLRRELTGLSNVTGQNGLPNECHETVGTHFSGGSQLTGTASTASADVIALSPALIDTGVAVLQNRLAAKEKFNYEA